MESNQANKKSNLVFWLIVVAIILLIGGVVLFFKSTPSQSGKTVIINEGQPEAAVITFSSPKKTAHYESNTPAHGSVLAGAPVNIVLDFNFDLAPGSEISIKKDGKESGVGATIIDDNKLAMRKNMDPNAPNGLYTVQYRACWADGSCHDGSFQFAINKAIANDFLDMRGKKEIVIDMVNISFESQNVIISRGTKVTWVNKDGVIHTVNSDAHPAHTYYLPQNSRNLKKGDTFSITFDQAGIYPYHCTPHANRMIGTVLVQ